MSTTTAQHIPGTVSERDGFVTWHVGVCSCGWRTSWLSLRPRAWQAADEHARIENDHAARKSHN
jgi:hypothetical protein